MADPGQIRDAWRRALDSPGPSLVEFVTDPTVPPIPPHASLDQMEATASALLKGDPEAWAVLNQGIRGKAQEFLAATSRG